MRVKSKITSVAIGSFDGIHLAHQELIKYSQALLVIEHSKGRLTHGFKRSWFTKKPIFFLMLSKIKEMTPEEFVSFVGEIFPDLKRIVVGYDFAFGKNRAGSLNDLKRLFDGEVFVVPEVKMGGISIHSRVIDRLLRDGNLIMANKMLGRNYQIDGFQIKGQGLGSREFVPTINLKIKNYTLPRDGVYATFTRVGEERFKSITFLGHRSTTDGSFAVETHILDRAIKSEDNQRLFVEFVSDIRTNRKFESFGELKAQIDLDIKRAKEIMGEK